MYFYLRNMCDLKKHYMKTKHFCSYLLQLHLVGKIYDSWWGSRWDQKQHKYCFHYI